MRIHSLFFSIFIVPIFLFSTLFAIPEHCGGQSETASILLFQIGGRKNILPKIPEKFLEIFSSAAKRILATTPHPIFLQPGTFQFTGVKEALDLLKQELFKRGPEGASSCEVKAISNKTFGLNRCPFCALEIINKQVIVRSVHNNLVANIVPYVESDKHFLITPKK